MSTMYRVWYNQDIKAVDVVKRTKHFVTIQETNVYGKTFTRRDKIDSAEMKYFDTWLEAKNYLIERTQGRIAMAERNLYDLRIILQNLRLKEEP